MSQPHSTTTTRMRLILPTPWERMHRGSIRPIRIRLQSLRTKQHSLLLLICQRRVIIIKTRKLPCSINPRLVKASSNSSSLETSPRIPLVSKPNLCIFVYILLIKLSAESILQSFRKISHGHLRVLSSRKLSIWRSMQERTFKRV